MFGKSSKKLDLAILVIALTLVSVSLAGASATEIFSDGFESGNLSGWDRVKGKNSLDVNEAAAMVGDYGLEITVNHKRNPHYLIDYTPVNAKRYRARFYVNMNDLEIGPKVKFQLIKARRFKGKPFYLKVRFSEGKHWVKAIMRTDNGRRPATDWVELPAGKSFIEFDWKAADDAATHNGHLYLWVNDILVGEITEVNNDKHSITSIHFGVTRPLNGAKKAFGAIYLDDYVSDSEAYIGPAAEADAPDFVDVTATTDTTFCNDVMLGWDADADWIEAPTLYQVRDAASDTWTEVLDAAPVSWATGLSVDGDSAVTYEYSIRAVFSDYYSATLEVSFQCEAGAITNQSATPTD